MPDGLVQWFDERSGEGAVLRGRRTYVVRAGDVEPVARRAGARVHFDIAREDGVERAVRVTLRAGTRTGHGHARAGTLVGARRPDTKGTAPFATARPEEGRMLAAHPLEVALVWAGAVAQGDSDAALAVCSPELRVHLPGHDLAGRRRLVGWLEEHPAFGCRRSPELRGDGGDVEVRWAGNGHDAGLPGVRCRVRHGWITEEWPLKARRPTRHAAAAHPSLPVETLAGEGVHAEEVAYARERLRRLAARRAEPVLFARVKLAVAGDPARERRARAEALFDVNGEPVRAAVAAEGLREAIDLLDERLRDQLEHRAERREALHRWSGRPEPGTWRHGTVVPPRPEHFDRPVGERELVRLKSLATRACTPDEASLEMDLLDYHFYLFRDLATGADSLVERDPSGSVLLTRLGADDGVDTGSASIAPSRRRPPRLGLEEAMRYLEVSGDTFVFFEDANTGRGNVCYLRYDGNYGVVVPG